MAIPLAEDVTDISSIYIVIKSKYYYIPSIKIRLLFLFSNGKLVDCIVIKKVSILTFASLIGKYKKGLIYDNHKYKRIAFCKKASKIIIESPKILTICIDGETIHRNKVTIEVLKHKIRFLLPQK